MHIATAIKETVKDSPWIVLLGSSGTIIALVTALFSVDARYAHAVEVEKNYQQIQQAVQQTSNNLRKQMLEDKIFELEVKRGQQDGKLSPIESALLERYKRQIKDLENLERK